MMPVVLRGGETCRWYGPGENGGTLVKVIVTGGTGLIGRALAEDLAGDGH